MRCGAEAGYGGIDSGRTLALYGGTGCDRTLAMCERAADPGTLTVYGGTSCNRTLAMCERAVHSGTLAGYCRAVYGRARNAHGVVVVIVSDCASSGSSVTIQGAFDGNVLVLAAQVGEGLEEAVTEEGEQIIAYARVRGHGIREFILKRGQKWWLDVDHVVTIVDPASIVGV